MRLNLKLSLLGCALAGAMIPLAATAADLNNPYVHRASSGSWTNVEYNDGSCHYYYAHNSYDGETKLNKYGDRSQRHGYAALRDALRRRGSLWWARADVRAGLCTAAAIRLRRGLSPRTACVA
jgi:hypothetical protein